MHHSSDLYGSWLWNFYFETAEIFLSQSYWDLRLYAAGTILKIFSRGEKVENFYQEMIKTFPDMNEGDAKSAEKFFAVSGDEDIFY